MRKVGMALLGLGFSLAMMGQASAVTPCQTETPIGTVAPVYTCLNGATTFPGTDVGVVGFGTGQVDQIGSITLYNSGSGGAFVNTSHNPSIYEFIWDGGALHIQEKAGNNGIGDNIFVELDSLATHTSTSPSAILSSIEIPFSSGPSPLFDVWNGDLASGFYALDTFLDINAATDPNFEVDFSQGVTEAPEPATLALMGAALLGLGWSKRRKKSA